MIAALGHGDMLVICDAGLPIPAEIERVDLALTQGIPGFIDTLKVVLQEMQVERVIIAEEMRAANPQIYEAVLALMEGVQITCAPHTEFKQTTRQARAIVRTGEYSPYSNIILVSGVVF